MMGKFGYASITFTYFSNDTIFQNLTILWFKEFSGSGEESIGHFVLTCEDNGFLQVGETYDYSNLSSKIFIVKINANGQFHLE